MALASAYELLTACCEERWDDARHWQERLKPLAVEQNGEQLYPELYVVPQEALDAERDQPGSQQRYANDNVPLLWTQSLSWLGDAPERSAFPEDLPGRACRPCQGRIGCDPGASQCATGDA